MAKLKVSSVHRFVEAFSGEKVWIGVDVHKLSFSVALLRPDSAVKDWTCPADATALTRLVMSLPVEVGAVCYESGPTGFELARSLEAEGVTVVVAAPSRIPRPITATNKTDSLDCRKLAELAASGLIRPIAIPSVEAEAFRALERRRHQLTDSLRRAKQRIRSLLLYLGAQEPADLDHWSKAAILTLHQVELPSGAKETLESLLDELEYFACAQRKVDQRLRISIREQDEARRIAAMRSVPGVGEVVATTFAAEVYRPERFNRSEEVTAYLGLAPVMRQSGGSKGKATLRPVGQKRLRSLLIEAAWVWKQRDEWAREFYNRIYSRHGVAQKAIAALARKLAALLWKLSLPVTQS
ncbi:IS110 family transposase [Pseudodesulfovibrio thermohalotolerans]|uniref:IS110 family transposase n=1 Tax=Pseudodesulfovibrio thermohalotolerans TaxID=2880651 RepID=UPI002441CE3E|nr:IS110 family transposase [Pseudodesulfovibrio thermohalotolerans]WFS63008.1 IS110 family transposase [Pseudodesulfovibrio thermohalotolerans]